MKEIWDMNLDLFGCNTPNGVREKPTKFRSCLTCKKDELKPQL